MAVTCRELVESIWTMSALIKRSDAGRIASVRALATSPTAIDVDNRSSFQREEDDRIATLEAALRDAEALLVEAQRDHEAQIDKVRRRAHDDGAAAGKAASDALFAAIADSAAHVRAQAHEALHESGAVGLAIARAALAEVFADGTRWPAMIEAIVAKRRAALENELLVRVRVSATDFTDLAGLQRAMEGQDAIEVIADPLLASGACLFELRVGEIEVGPRMQARNILTLLDTHIAEGFRA